MAMIKEVLATKGSEVWTIPPDNSVQQALSLLAEKDIGALLVTEGEQPVGIFSERDFARNYKKSGCDYDSTPVKELMTKKILYIEPDKTVGDAMVIMTDKHIRHLPVMENNKLVGIVTIGDVVKTLIKEQGKKIRDLEMYITGGA